MQLVLCVKRKT